MDLPKIFIHILCLSLLSCAYDAGSDDGASSKQEQEKIIKRRENGTISSVNQVDEMGMVHGMRVTYYADGKTIHSKLSLTHGVKNGPYIRYYKNGKVFEHSAYQDGKRHGSTRIYHKNGQLLAAFSYDKGRILPGLKEYLPDGSLCTDYPEIVFKEEDHLETRNRIDLFMSCVPPGPNVKYYVREGEGEQKSRVYLISEKGRANMHFYIAPGQKLNRKIHIIAEIPTSFGNVLVKEIIYDLSVEHKTGEKAN